MTQASRPTFDLSPQRRALLEALLKKEGVASAPTSTIPRRVDTDAVPLSFAQERLWFLDQLEPNSAFYTIPSAVRLTGRLHVAALEEAVNEIVRRHEALRTTFPAVDGQPFQRIAPDLRLRIPIVDLTLVPVTEREAEARRLADEEAIRPFDLAEGPLVRVTLLRLAEEEHWLLVTTHHIVSDGWSKGIFVRELSALYEAFCAGRPSPLPELAIQYPDFAVWQREWLQGEVLATQLAYWKQQLGKRPTVMELPTDRPRPPVQSYRGATHQFVLSSSLSEGLRALSQRAEVTLFMTLLAAFQALLARYTGEEHVVVGTPIAGRTRAEIEGLIGVFVNSLVMRTSVSGDPTFRELLGRVREVALGAYAHQDLPFEKLVAELQPERSRSHTPLFQVMFALQNVPTVALQLSGVTWSPLKVGKDTAKLDLMLAMAETPQGVRAELEYNTDLFDEATITRLVGHFEMLLAGIVADPDQRLSRLPLLTEPEHQQLLLDWNRIEPGYPRDTCVHHRIEAHAERAPEARAVTCDGASLTYAQLNSRANQLAHHLRRLGVRGGTRVGIYVERSLEMMVGLLGILKAGGAYVPLDPAYPQERLAFMLEDAGIPVLLTQERLLGSLPDHGARRLCLDSDWSAIARESEANPDSGVTGEDLAYVIYTSGSTGRPKGVQVSHYSVLHLFDATQPLLRFGEQDVWTVFHSYAFDFSVWEIWGALIPGGRLVIVPLEVAQSPELLYELLCAERVTILNQTPSALGQLVPVREEAARVGREWQLRLIVSGGEALPRELACDLLQWGLPIWNFYGPTEATVWATLTRLEPSDTAHGNLPIGRPFSGAQIYLLDHALQPVPVGVPGELHIGGIGVARGYLNRPELTAEKFVPDPFSGEPGARLYKTGDLARYWLDGTLEYLGRIDHQVKLRGFRIELGEIEAVLSQHQAVHEAVVIVREDEPGEKRLVAYVVPQPGDKPSISEIRQFVKQKLPEYMAPSHLVLLEEMPLSPNRKVDRRALPAPDQQRPVHDYVAPRDPLEQRLAQIWEQVLGVQGVGVNDNFFDLGGHSLLAVRLFAQIKKAWGRDLPLAVLFQAPTIEQLAEILRQEGWSASWRCLVAIQEGGTRPPFFCVHARGGNVLYYRELARRLGPDQPLYGLQARGLDGKQPCHTSAEEMAVHYIQEIRALQPRGPYHVGGASLGGIVAFEMARQLMAQGEEVALLALFDTYSPAYSSSVRRITAFERLQIHLGNLMLLGPREQLDYVRSRKNKIKARFWQFATRLSRQRQQRLPTTLRKIEEANMHAVGRYVPQVYPGKITLFRATRQLPVARYDPTLGWGEFAGGELEIHEVPGYHGNIIREPRARVLARILTGCLAQGGTANAEER